MTRDRRFGRTVDPDVDLDDEEVILPDGQRLTTELAERMAEEGVARHPGRPSLSGERRHSPVLTIRVVPATMEVLEAIAKQQGRRVSEVTRDALDEYAERHS